jgi:hypothetical protein
MRLGSRFLRQFANDCKSARRACYPSRTMKFREPLEITRPNCRRRVSFETAKSFLGQDWQCLECGARLAPLQESIRASIRDFDDFVRGATFIVRIENRWKFELSDNDARLLTSGQSIRDFVVGSLNARGVDGSSDVVWEEVRQMAAEALVVPVVTLDIDLLGPFRRSLDKTRG